MRLFPSRRTVDVRGPMVYEMFGDPSAPRYPQLLDFEEARECGCADCSSRMEEAIARFALFDER
jgi:hypothetical protein